MYVRVSDITNYLYCPRVCYFRDRFEDSCSMKICEMHVMRELYHSKRAELGVEWAKEKFINYFGEESSDFFLSVSKKFVYNPQLDKLKRIDWEVLFSSEKFRLKGILDEIVIGKSGRNVPLILSLKVPETPGDIWFKDKIKLTAFSMLLDGVSEGYVYHCLDGVIRHSQIGRKDRRNVLKLVEKVIAIKKGFIPSISRKKNDGKRCDNCNLREECNAEGSTFASRFF